MLGKDARFTGLCHHQTIRTLAITKINLDLIRMEGQRDHPTHKNNDKAAKWTSLQVSTWKMLKNTKTSILDQWAADQITLEMHTLKRKGSKTTSPRIPAAAWLPAYQHQGAEAACACEIYFECYITGTVPI